MAWYFLGVWPDTPATGAGAGSACSVLLLLIERDDADAGGDMLGIEGRELLSFPLCAFEPELLLLLLLLAVGVL